MPKKPTSHRPAAAARSGRATTTTVDADVKTQVSPAEVAEALARPNRLTATEEKALRMTHGVSAPRTLVLERVGQNHPEARAKLLGIELELLRQFRARQSAQATVTTSAPPAASITSVVAPANPKRDRIVAALKAKKPTK